MQYNCNLGHYSPEQFYSLELFFLFVSDQETLMSPLLVSNVFSPDIIVVLMYQTYNAAELPLYAQQALSHYYSLNTIIGNNLYNLTSFCPKPFFYTQNSQCISVQCNSIKFTNGFSFLQQLKIIRKVVSRPYLISYIQSSSSHCPFRP